MITASVIDKSVIDGINRGDERAFAVLYNNYFTYLCTCAVGYIFDADAAKEIVNDVFVHIWNKQTELEFPIHSYLLRCVQNGCLNYIRSLRSREKGGFIIVSGRILPEWRNSFAIAGSRGAEKASTCSSGSLAGKMPIYF